MPAYYVTETGNNSDGLTWAKAFTTFAGAITAATADGDIIYVDQGFTDTLTADTTWTLSNNIRVICSNDKVNEPPQTLGVMGTSAFIGNSSTSYILSFSTGAYKVFVYGLTFRNGGSSSKTFYFGPADAGHAEFENCYFWMGNAASALKLTAGASGSGDGCYQRFLNCTFRFAATGQGITPQNRIDFTGCTLSGDGSAPSTLFALSTRSTLILSENCDWSLTNTALVASQSSIAVKFVFSNCKLHSSLSSVLATQSPANKGSATAWLFNCSGADQHYHLQHHDAFGSTVIDTGIYANDGAQYDGTNRCSWKIVTTANCSYYTPYISPWIDCYHSGTSAITPSLEIVRSGSATAYQDDEVWGEFSYQGTSGFPLGIIVSDRKALLAAAADQTTGALGASDWTGENATSWFGKLNPTATITPAEIGHLRARVVVGEPSITVYVDPQIRGRS